MKINLWTLGSDLCFEAISTLVLCGRVGVWVCCVRPREWWGEERERSV